MNKTPGSETARKKGCRCPVILNNFGAGSIYPDGYEWTFFVSNHCKIHSLSYNGKEKENFTQVIWSEE